MYHDHDVVIASYLGSIIALNCDCELLRQQIAQNKSYLLILLLFSPQDSGHISSIIGNNPDGQGAASMQLFLAPAV
jgi:hypothetical protein